MAFTIEQHQEALAKAQASGDDEAVAVISKRIEQTQHLNAYDKATAAGDVEAADIIAQRYRGSRGSSWSREDARSDPMWVKNARTLYKDAEKKDFTGSDTEAADWLSDYMSDFNYRLVPLAGEAVKAPPGSGRALMEGNKKPEAARGTTDIALNVKNFSKEGKSAFLTAMDDFDALPASWEGTGELAKRAVTDPSTLIGAGTFGIGTGVKEGAKEAAKQGIKQALKFGAKQAAKAGAISGAEGAVYGGTDEALRETAEIGAGRREDYDPSQIARSAGTAALLSGAVGTGLRSVVDAPGVVGTVAKGLNKLEVEDSSAAGRLANRFQKLEEQDGFNLGVIDEQADKGAKQAIGTSHSAIAQEINDNARLLDDLLNPQKAASPADAEVRSLAQQALRAARSKEKAFTTAEQLAAVQQLVGKTREGARLIDLIKERNELYRVNNRGLQGGVSRFTDKLNPLARHGRFSADNMVISSLPGAVSLYGGVHSLGATLAGQAGAVIGGRGIDALTGRRSLPRLFMKQNLGKEAGKGGFKLPSVLEKQNAELAQKETDRQYRDNLKKLAATSSLQMRMQKQREKEVGQLVRTRTGLNKQFQSEESKQLKEQMSWQKERQRLLNAEQKAKSSADRQKVQQERRQLDVVYKQLRIKQALEKQQAQQIVSAIGGPQALKKAMKPLGKALSEKKAKPAADTGVIKDTNPIRNRDRWEYQKNRIIGMEASAREAAKNAPTDVIGRAINRAVDAFQRIKSIDTKGASAHDLRMEAYEKVRDVAANDTELQYIEESLDALARVFEHKNRKKKP